VKGSSAREPWTGWWPPATPHSSPRNARARGRPGRGAQTAGRRGAPAGRPEHRPAIACARAAGVHVVHCLVQRRPDGLGANHNAKIFRIGSIDRGDCAGHARCRTAARIRARPNRCGAARWHGIGPRAARPRRHPAQSRRFHHRGGRGQCERRDHQSGDGRRPTPPTASSSPATPSPGFPADYADAVIDNTLSLLATITTTRRPARGFF